MKHTLLTLSMLLLSHVGYAQQTIEKIAEAELKSTRNLNLKSKQLKTENPNNYDVTRYDLSFDLTNTSNQFSGVSKVYATVVNNTATIKLDAQSNLNITSVLLFDNPIDYNRNPNTITVNLDRTYNAGEELEIKVSYNSNYYNAIGIFSDSHGYYPSTPLITTLSEPDGASSWWVGADNLYDKADEVNIYVRHNAAYKVGSNGKLMANTPQNDGTVITHWRTAYPIPAYLISLGMTNYEEYNHTATVGNVEVPIINYIYPEDNTSNVQSQLDNVPGYLEFFSELIGDYPYKEEKYGHVQWNWGGGMEHATMSSQNSFGSGLTAHELAHQWFGDKITCGTWSDIWLNEGFATYFEGLLRRNSFGESFFRDWKQGKLEHITYYPNGSVYIPENELSEDRIFSSRLSYNKGAMVLNMLRFKLGDEDFYQAIRNYLEDPSLAYGFAVTPDLIEHLEAVSQEDLTEFFADWVYGEGYPTFNLNVALNADKKSGVLTVSQYSSHNSVDFFETPFDVKFIGANGQSAIRKFDLTSNNQNFEVEALPFEVIDYQFNPNFDIIAVVDSENLGTQDVTSLTSVFSIYPNPVKHNFFALSSESIEKLNIYNVEGKLVKSFDVNSNEAEVSMDGLPKGVYIVEAQTKNGVKTKKIIKQ